MLYSGLGLGLLLVLIGGLTYSLAPRVGPNPIFGVRIGYAYASREIWDKSNRFGGVLMAAVGVGTAMLGWLLTVLNIGPAEGMAWLIGGMLAGLLGAVVWMFVYARRLARGTPIAREVKPVRFRWGYLAPLLVTFAMVVLLTVYFYPSLPADRMATHFNIGDQPDGWMSRDLFAATYLALSGFFVVMDLVALLVATREPLIAFGRWGTTWQMDPERGFIYAGISFAFVELILAGTLLNVIWFNTRGTLLFPFGALLWALVTAIAVLVALFFALAKHQVGGEKA